MGWKAQTLGEVLAARAASRGSAEALVTPSARLSYAQLLADARHAAGSLAALGVRKGEHVGILMGNGEQWLALFYGAALIGAVTVPLNTRFQAAELGWGIKQAKCKVTLYTSGFLGRDFGAMLREAGVPGAHCIEDRLPPGEFREAEVSPGDLLLIQFTSGTTAPKGRDAHARQHHCATLGRGSLPSA
jgi:fatty-acyl-CoA synthase